MQLITFGFAPNPHIPDDYRQVNYTLSGPQQDNIIFIISTAPGQQ
jgi:hypothetical protein